MLHCEAGWLVSSQDGTWLSGRFSQPGSASDDDALLAEYEHRMRGRSLRRGQPFERVIRGRDEVDGRAVSECATPNHVARHGGIGWYRCQSKGAKGKDAECRNGPLQGVLLI